MGVRRLPWLAHRGQDDVQESQTALLSGPVWGCYQVTRHRSLLGTSHPDTTLQLQQPGTTTQAPGDAPGRALSTGSQTRKLGTQGSGALAKVTGLPHGQPGFLLSAGRQGLRPLVRPAWLLPDMPVNVQGEWAAGSPGGGPRGQRPAGPRPGSSSAPPPGPAGALPCPLPGWPATPSPGLCLAGRTLKFT